MAHPGPSAVTRVGVCPTAGRSTGSGLRHRQCCHASRGALRPCAARLAGALRVSGRWPLGADAASSDLGPAPRGHEGTVPPLHDSSGPRKWTQGDPQLCRVPSPAPTPPRGPEAQGQHSLVQRRRGLGGAGARDLGSPLGDHFPLWPHHLRPLLLFPENLECADLDSGTTSHALSDRGNRRPAQGSPPPGAPLTEGSGLLRLLPAPSPSGPGMGTSLSLVAQGLHPPLAVREPLTLASPQDPWPSWPASAWPRGWPSSSTAALQVGAARCGLAPSPGRRLPPCPPGTVPAQLCRKARPGPPCLCAPAAAGQGPAEGGGCGAQGGGPGSYTWPSVTPPGSENEAPLGGGVHEAGLRA